MTLKIAVQMDPIEAIDIAGDSTFALMLEAQARGHELFEYHADTLALRDGALSATGADVQVRDEVGKHFQKTANRTVQLEDFDAVLMRQDPPFDMNYITYTHMLEAIHPKTLVVNDPAEVRNAPEKLYVLQYNEFIPPTLISRDPQRLSEFRDEFGDIILKPLYGNGGAGVFRLCPHRTRPEAARPDLRRHRCHRRLHDRNQRHLAHRYSGSQKIRRRRHRGPCAGRHRSAPWVEYRLIARNA